MKIFSAEYVIPLSGPILFDGAVAIEHGEIIDVGQEEELLKRYPDAQHENYSHHAILPGLINAHAHIDLSLYKNYSGDPVRNVGVKVNYIDWLLGLLKYKHNIDFAHLREAVEEGLDECIQFGTTCVAEMGNYEGIFSILEQKGLRGVVFPEVMSFDSTFSKDLFESAMAIVEKYQEEDSDLITVGMGPYAPYLLSRNILRLMAQYCRSSNLPLMMHVSGTFSEMEFFHNSTGDIASKLFPDLGWEELPPAHQRTPVEHLKEIGFLDCQPILVNCIQTTEKDLDLIAQTGSKIVITPRCGHNMQQGQPNFKKIDEKKILTALGTDGLSTVDTLSLWDEMRAFVEFNLSLSLTGERVLKMVTSHAAQVLGLGEDVGTLEIGKQADLIVVDVSSVKQEGDFLMNLIQTIHDYHIHLVLVRGAVLKSVN